MGETVYWVDGRCYSCGSTEVKRLGLRMTRCGGCNREIGTSLWTRARRATPADAAEGKSEPSSTPG